MPKLSFVVPTHNRVEWLPICIESLLGQSEEDIEVVIVNDASTDGTAEFLEFYKNNPRVRILTNETNLGAGMSRNRGAEAASAPIVAMADDDDVYINTHANRILQWFEDHPQSEAVNFPYVSIDFFENVLEPFYGAAFDHETYKEKATVNYFCNPSAAFRKSAMLEMGGYPPETPHLTDDVQFIDRWIKAGKRIDFCGPDKEGNVSFAVMHRILPDSMMAKMRGWDESWLKKTEKPALEPAS